MMAGTEHAIEEDQDQFEIDRPLGELARDKTNGKSLKINSL